MTDIGNYTLQHEVGAGGMAIVYAANHNTLNKQVAIKVLKKEFAGNDHIRKRFLAEARQLFELSHPNIIKVIDLVERGDLIGFAMEYINGETLKDFILRTGPLSNEKVIELFSQMLAAVECVHEHGLIHRDIKPSNFMIAQNGKVKLLDFGIAKNTDVQSEEYTLTGTGFQMGTPLYMSPEQITETKSVTYLTDIYSLGVVLWQMVTARKPYDTQTLSHFQLLTKVVNEKLPPTHTPWDEIIQKATQKDEHARYGSCQSFASDVRSMAFDDHTRIHTAGQDSRRSSADSETSQNRSEQTQIESTQVPTSSLELITCPRCLGKGYVDTADIERLKRSAEWMPGQCAYCNGDGQVTRDFASKNSPDAAELAYSLFDMLGEEETESQSEKLDHLFTMWIETYFKDLVGKEKIYLNPTIPEKKLQHFANRFNPEIFDQAKVFVFQDDTIFGKGDDGFALMEHRGRKYLLIGKLTGEIFAICLTNDQVNDELVDCRFDTSKGVTLTLRAQSGTVSTHQIGYNSLIGKALVGFLRVFKELCPVFLKSPSTYCIVLLDAGSNKLKVLGVVKTITGQGLSDAMHLVDHPPKIILQTVSLGQAERVIALLTEAGAKVMMV